jgi:hypothetical protein
MFDELIVFGLILSHNHQLIDLLGIVSFQVRVDTHSGAVTQPPRDVGHSLGLRGFLKRLVGCRICCVFIHESLGWREVVGAGCRTASQVLLPCCLRARALELDGNLVETPKNLKIHLYVCKHSEVLGLKRYIDSVLSTRQKLSLCGHRMEMCDLGEIKVKGQVLILVFDGQVVVSAVILRAITECDVLSADFNIRVAGSCHHLHFEVIELLLIGASDSHWELDKSHRSVFFRLYHILFFAGAAKGALLSSRLSALSMVRETTDFIVLLGTADKSNGKLRIWSDHSLQRLSSKHSLSLFLASSGRGN